ncbi:MAG: Gfo/Idh/MocA family oxidoreductase [Planctomycetales bacterium]|nr:Gfo/Idh/MocA family oxidoreductase [Planctomycetales bacterium]
MDRRQFAVASSALLLGSHVFSQSPSSDLRVAVIGHTGRGDYGHGLDTVWQRLPGTSIVAVADASAVGLKKELVKLGLPEASGYDDYRRMLSKVSPDLVAVCPRHADQHRDMILAAVRSGAKGVYVEKPFVRTPGEADEILAACDEHGTKVAIAHRNRYHPVMKVIVDLIKEGRIGRILEIRGRGKGDRRGGGEDLWVLGSHVLNMIAMIAGKPGSCSAVSMQDGRPATKQDLREGAEGLGLLAGNELHARYRFENGMIAYFDSIANDETRNEGFGLQIIGSEGQIFIRADRDPLAYLVPGNPFQPQQSPSRWLPITSGGVDVDEPNPELIQRVQHHDVAAEDLISAIGEDRQPLCSAAEATQTIEMICAVFHSHVRGGMEVRFPLMDREHPFLKW